MFRPLLRTAFFMFLGATGWSCGGVSDEARQQSAESVEHGLGYLRECDAQGRCNVPAAIVAWERSLRLNPENADAHRYLGTEYGAEGRFPQAETHLRRAVELYARQSREDERLRSPLAECRVTLGVVLVNLNRPDDAIPLFISAVEKKKKFAAFPWQLATFVRSAKFMPAWLYDRIAGKRRYRE